MIKILDDIVYVGQRIAIAIYLLYPVTPKIPATTDVHCYLVQAILKTSSSRPSLVQWMKLNVPRQWSPSPSREESPALDTWTY